MASLFFGYLFSALAKVCHCFGICAAKFSFLLGIRAASCCKVSDCAALIISGDAKLTK